MKPLHSISYIFESLKDDGYFAITYLDKSMVQFFFQIMIQVRIFFNRSPNSSPLIMHAAP